MAEYLADTDILEISVRGTQSISINEEPSVRSEVEKITNEFGDIEVPQDLQRQQDLKLQCTPLVYTTRLDEMNALNKVKKSTSKELSDMILIESKPQYELGMSQVKREPINDLYITSYVQLCARVQELNSKARNEENLRQYEIYAKNEKLLKMCKPLRIVLEDIKKKNKALQMEKKAEDLSCYEEDNLFSDDNMPLSARRFVINLLSTYDILIAIKHISSQNTEVYVVGNKGLKQYFNTNINNFKSLQKLHDNNKKVLLQYCCWLEREKSITLLANSGTFDIASNCAFLRNNHSCPSRGCICCCRKVGVHKRKNVKVLNPNIVQSVPKTVQLINKIIAKASNYIPSVPVSKTVTESKQLAGYITRAVIIIKYQGVIRLQTKKLGEHYEIGATGNIDRYVIPTVNHTVTETINIYRLNDKLKGVNRIFYFDLICCWHKRQKFMVQIKKLQPSAYNFIRMPHLCGIESKCDCCCKPANIAPLEHINKNIPKKLQIHQKTQQQRPVLVQSFENILDANKTNKTVSNNTLSSPVTDTFQTKGVECNVPFHGKATPQFNGGINNTNEQAIAKTIQDDTNLTIDANFIQKPTKNIQPQESLRKSNIPNQVIPEGLESTILNGVLGRFKNLKLVVGKTGKLTAEINAAPGSLTTVEISVLSDILSLASVQIAQLGITAEEFCNRVNTSRANGQTGLPVPQLVPIVSTSSPPPEPAVTVPVPAVPVSAPVIPVPAPALSLAPLVNTKVKKRATLKGVSEKPQCETNKLSKVCHYKITPVSNIYESMSSLGGRKNSQLVFAYHLYFKRKDPLKDSSQYSMSSPKITDVRTLVKEDPSISQPCERAAPKRSHQRQTKEPNKKQCVQPFAKILPKTQQMPVPRTKQSHEQISAPEVDSYTVRPFRQMLPKIQQMPVPQTQQNLEYISASEVDSYTVRPFQQTLNQTVSQSKPMIVIDNNIAVPQPLQVVNNNVLPFLYSGGSYAETSIGTNGGGPAPLYGAGIHLVASNVSAAVPNPNYNAAINAGDMGGPATNKYPLLCSLITKDSAPPTTLNGLVNVLPVAPNPRTSATSLILAHSQADQPNTKRRKMSHTREELQNDADVESVIRTNIIKIEKSDLIINASPDVVNYEPIMIDDDDDDNVDCIFGV